MAANTESPGAAKGNQMTDGARPELLMYARQRFCPDVNRARARLAELALPWVEYDTESDAEALDRMIAISGRSNVPTLVIGERVLVEPSADEIDEALVAAGYDVAALAGSPGE